MKIERRYMAHYLNAGFGGAENYCRLGADLEEYSPELTANVEKKSNILGQTSVTIDSYQKQGEVSPYYAEEGDALFTKLQAIIDGDMVLDDLKTDIVEVKRRGLSRRQGRVLHRNRQLRRRHHRLSDPVQCPLHGR